MNPEVVLDGSRGEGGGQILRSALTLSALTGRPFRIRRIRAARGRPGLRPQHVAAVQAMARITGAEVEGNRVDSETLAFRPGPVNPGRFHVAVGTAGAVPLILQTMILPLAFQPSDSEIVLTGGTHVPWSPPADYLRCIWLPLLAAMGVEADLAVERAGWVPAGGGYLRCRVRGRGRFSLRPLALGAPAPVESIRLQVVISGLPMHIPNRMIERARGRLRTILPDAGCSGVEIREEIGVLGADGPGVMFLLEARAGGARAGWATIGRKGRPAEAVAGEAVDGFERFLAAGATVDAFAADQLLLPCAVAAGTSAYRTPEVTEHLRTQIGVVQMFLDVPVDVESGVGKAGGVRVAGRGWRGAADERRV